MTEGQTLALEQLRAIESASTGQFEVLGSVPVRPPDWVGISIALACTGLEQVPTGLRLRAREPVTIIVPPDFPFRPPAVSTPHRRFAGFPHVQWGRSLCLYAAPNVEWDVSDGMFGFVDRLMDWFAAAARDELDPLGAPIHPPVAYPSSGPGHAIVVRADAPEVPSSGWFGTAQLAPVTPNRLDLVGWSELFAPETPQPAAAALLLTEPMPFEYPERLGELLTVLEERGVSRNLVFLALRAAAVCNDDATPLYVVIGTPMRGVKGSTDLRQHLLVWYIEPVIADGLRLSLAQFSSDPARREIGDKLMELITSWAEKAPVGWCQVFEQRPEVTVRRDHAARVSSFQGKSVAVWGCGAIGANVAMLLARAGVGRLVLRDSGRVTPGILVRQPFEDLHIGRPKAEALKEILLRIVPSLDVEAFHEDLLRSLAQPDWTNGVDVIIEASASQSVVAMLEQRRRQTPAQVPLVISMAVDADARRGVVAASHPTAAGGPADAMHAAKLAALGRAHLVAYADAFWPATPRQRFFPEPGCSSPTFVGSAADLGALSSAMLNIAGEEMVRTSGAPARVHFLSGVDHAVLEAKTTLEAVDVPAALVLDDPGSGYQVRIAASAWSEIRGWAARGRRVLGSRVETGGILFGERDDSLKIVWVDEVLGPPPDSEASELGFVCGTAGVAETAAEKSERSRGSLKCVGLWHTHPGGLPIPSPTDFRGMRQVVASTDPSTPRSLMLIVGGEAPDHLLAGRLFKREEFQAEELRVQLSMERVEARGPSRIHRIGLALSGGGARAIAFHLGCLRALHDRGVLTNVSAISAVSGGSIIAGLYAYGQESFEEFDRRVVELLRRGLLGGIARRAFVSPYLLGALGTAAIAGTAAVAADATRTALSAGATLLGPMKRRASVAAAGIQPPLRRWISRTTAFERTLHDQLFRGLTLASPRRPGLSVVFNACELRSGSAFRFGDRESGCWRYGRLRDNRVPISLAVAASAAYPVLLPALDLEFDFVARNGTDERRRVLLTDGGVYDNLGSSCLEPDRSEQYSYNVFPMEYIICCDAGHGLFDTQGIPYWWGPRLSRSFQAVFRKAQNAGQDRLHRLAQSGALKGFVLAYLGQQDASLPYLPADLVRRGAVYGYPTDFSPMASEDLDQLVSRGERLTRLLIDHYCSEL